ncbi:hypothetical protein BZA05DRAFT_411148 [Tricharina praecox]|uniref:uncharacterized protein n=1 Tax=Tricharina praecox TaxID=43433 RepID=UPI00222101C3|nr:uncharacterized protein BZA05DRAFT_411148 [Tricharina praecox]KAI5843274.1 hypothetical protein BZA05DRAFT_411148 [Tricharina praecox]
MVGSMVLLRLFVKSAGARERSGSIDLWEGGETSWPGPGQTSTSVFLPSASASAHPPLLCLVDSLTPSASLSPSCSHVPPPVLLYSTHPPRGQSSSITAPHPPALSPAAWSTLTSSAATAAVTVTATASATAAHSSNSATPPTRPLVHSFPHSLCTIPIHSFSLSQSISHSPAQSLSRPFLHLPFSSSLLYQSSSSPYIPSSTHYQHH